MFVKFDSVLFICMDKVRKIVENNNMYILLFSFGFMKNVVCF